MSITLADDETLARKDDMDSFAALAESMGLITVVQEEKVLPKKKEDATTYTRPGFLTRLEQRLKEKSWLARYENKIVPITNVQKTMASIRDMLRDGTLRFTCRLESPHDLNIIPMLMPEKEDAEGVVYLHEDTMHRAGFVDAQGDVVPAKKCDTALILSATTRQYLLSPENRNLFRNHDADRFNIAEVVWKNTSVESPTLTLAYRCTFDTITSPIEMQLFADPAMVDLAMVQIRHDDGDDFFCYENRDDGAQYPRDHVVVLGEATWTAERDCYHIRVCDPEAVDHVAPTDPCFVVDPDRVRNEMVVYIELAVKDTAFFHRGAFPMLLCKYHGFALLSPTGSSSDVDFDLGLVKSDTVQRVRRQKYYPGQRKIACDTVYRYASNFGSSRYASESEMAQELEKTGCTLVDHDPRDTVRDIQASIRKKQFPFGDEEEE